MHGIKITVMVAMIAFLSYQTQGQEKYDIFWVSFTDKTGTPYSVFQPQDFLTVRALERRIRYNIPIVESDLPVNPDYIEKILAKGYKLHCRSKWLNGIAIISDDKIDRPEELLETDFVKAVFPIGHKREIQQRVDTIGPRDYNSDYKKKKDYYGTGKNQIKMLKGHYIHKMGYDGRGMHIAIMDGGFSDMRECPVFDSLFSNDRILGTHDFVEGDDFVFESSSHGRNVASCIASNLPGLFVGTAPAASFYLFKTEDMGGEYRIEEYNWVAAAEEADRLGVDVINSSLGYNDFDDDSMDYEYKDIDGKTSAMTKAAQMAAKKGILVVSSAGNEGSGKWKHITVPADAESILTVGAVNRDGMHARFSSYGFPDRTYIKPNLMARGALSVVAAVKEYDTSYSNGTSFSSPILAGMVTSFWQAFPELSNMEIIHSLEQKGDNINNPDTVYGYGIPDFFASYKELRPSVTELNTGQEYYYQIINSASKPDILMKNMKATDIKISLQDTKGRVLWQSTQKVTNKEDKRLWYTSVPEWDELSPGVYFLYIRMDGNNKRLILLK